MSAYKNNINPSYAFRFSAEEIERAYSSSDDAFRAGDFLQAAQVAEQGGQIHGCALLMAGLIEQGMAILDRQESLSPVSRICRAYGLWLLSRSAEAVDVLDSIDAAADEARQASKLKQLISAPDIPIFVTSTMLPVVTDYDKSALRASSRCGQFTVKHVASPLGKNAYELRRADRALDNLIDTLPPAEKPALIFALTPQWVVPHGLEKISVPKVLWCHDSDHFLYQAYDNFRLYDMTIVNNSQEHFELTTALGIDCVSNIMLSSLCSPFPEPKPSTEKDIDVFVSGSTLSSTHSDKARFIYHLSQLENGHKPVVVVVDGYLPELDYFALLARSKFSPIINRYLGCPSPRWRDTLSASTCLLYPEGSLYGQISGAAYPYRPDSIAADIRRYLQAYGGSGHADVVQRTFSEAAQKDLEIYRGSRDANFELLMKYAVFTALVWRDGRKKTQPRVQRRAVWVTPHIDGHMFGQDNVCSKIAAYADTVEADLGGESDDKDFSNAAKLYVQLASTSLSKKKANIWRSRANAIVDRGLQYHPRSLLLRFNQAYWRFFESSPSPADASSMFESIIATFDNLEFDPLGSDMGLGLIMAEADQVFPYVEYGRRMISFAVCNKAPWLDNGNRPLISPKKLLLSLCHAYIGWARLQRGRNHGALERFRVALEIYRNNEPLLKMALRSMQAYLEECPTLGVCEFNDLLGVFFECVNACPSVLLTDTHRIVPLLHRAGRVEEIKYILEKWYQLGNIVYYPDGDPRVASQIEAIESLLIYREFFPRQLANKIKAWRERGIPLKGEVLSHFEEMVSLALLPHHGARSTMYRCAELLRAVYFRHFRRYVPLRAHNWLRDRWLKLRARMARLSGPLRDRRFN